MEAVKQVKISGIDEEKAVPAKNAIWKHKHILDLDDFTADEINLVMQTADAMHEILLRPIKKVPTLRGKIVVTLFYEASTRTRSSFELAAKNLSAEITNLTVSSSSITKGESLIDTLETMEALGADIVVMRHPCSGAPNLASQHIKASMINAGDGWHAHPTQALLDIYTMLKYKGSLKGLKVSIIGDIIHSRVAHSNIWGLTEMGADVTICGPATLLPKGVDNPQKYFPKVRVTMDINKAMEDADVVMGLRLQLERQQSGLLPSIREYARLYQITEERLSKANKDVIVMHPGPVNEDIEIASEVVHGKRSVITEQVTNGVAVRMALFYLLAGGSRNE